MVAPVELWDVAMRYRTVFGLLLVAAILAGDMHGQQTTRGREFYVAFLPNYHNGGDLAPDSLYLFIVADEPTNGTITYTNNLGQTLTRTFSITNPQQIFVHSVQYRPYELFGYNNNGQFATSNENEQISLRVFRVTADRDIALYALNQALTTSDATLVLPVTALGNEYYVMSYPSDGVVNTNGTLNGQYTPSEFVVVGIEDGTDVTIYPSAPTTESGMQVKTIRLNRGQAVLYQAEFSRTNLNYDLTGTRIVATKNIAVFAGHQRALVPVEMRGSLASRDQLYEQMIPRSVWGTTYIVTPFAEPQDAQTPPQGASDLYRVLAAENGTEVKVNGRVVAVLQRGQFYQAPLQQAALIESSQPVMVAQFKRSYSAGADLRLGDPFMMIIPPRRQYLSHYRFQACQVAHPSGGITYYEQYITVVTTPNNVNSILLDGDTLKADFKPVPNTCYVYANVRVGDGAHTITSPRLFGLYVYGYGYADSYGYVGGMAFLPDVPDINVSVGPDRVLCLGDSLTLSVIGNAASVKWSVAPGYPAVRIPCDTCHTITIAPTATTRLLLTGYDSLGCSVSDDVTITVYGKPQLRIRPDTVVCSDAPITLIAEGSFQTIQWQPTEGLGCSNCPQTTVTPQPGKEVVYTAIARNVGSEHCETRDSIRVRYARGIFGQLPPIVTLCQGDSVTFSLDYGGTVRWSPAQGLSCTDCKRVTIRPTRTTRYTVSGDSAGCTSQAIVEVRLIPRPTMVPLQDTTICEGESVFLQISTQGAERISIAPAEDVSCTNCSQPVFTPTQTRTYIITASSGTGSSACIVTDSMTITVRPRPTVAVDSTLPSPLCEGDTARVVVRIRGADSLRWEPADGVLCPRCDTVAIVATTTRTYTVTASTTAGCSSQATLAVTVHSRPTLALAPGDTAVCEGSTIRLHAESDGRLQWDSLAALDCYDCPDVELTATRSQRITVRSYSADGCMREAAFNLTVYQQPSVTLPPSVQLCTGKSIPLQPSGVQPQYRYQWTPSEGLSCTDCPAPVASPRATTTYVLTTISPQGCTDVDSVVVAVVPCRIALRARLEGTSSPVYRCDTAAFTIAIENPASESDRDVTIESIQTQVVRGSVVSFGAVLVEPRQPLDDFLSELPRAIAVGQQWIYRCTLRPASDEVAIEVRIRSEAGDTIITAVVRSAAQRLRASLVPTVEEGKPIIPGMPLEFSLELDAEYWPAVDLRTIEFEIRYPSALLYYTGALRMAERDDLTAGGWVFSAQETLRGTEQVLSIRGSGRDPLTRDGPLVSMEMGTLLGTTYCVHPSLAITLPPEVAPCVQPETSSREFVMQTCVRELRFVTIRPTTFRIRSIAPNPADETVAIAYEVGFETPVQLELLDGLGRRALQLFDGIQHAGVYELIAQLGQLPAGVYWCRYRAGGQTGIVPMHILR
ncbi:MAG: hypothetical protein KatS3mg040_0277 [Candidatus Kapaibacterium sp.]|nr:MAG: hypothetical protein KatS3mg040_0277 [Candidatus Kapabacteria bacterium]